MCRPICLGGPCLLWRRYHLYEQASVRGSYPVTRNREAGVGFDLKFRNK